ncbi:TonB-dependent receptor [Ameyamaea chiangmaiensis]|uniref:TonB-dependent receptor n=2 Tax=Ameyamaea chiangmaiensis TaxID=442969 RepID=A0A850P7E3_9PROT|nr:TonB-dependent receptor [Ameyamaea chiangmaiensis]NVN39834.1 TonB-dependent receptor [Ameyamaea chiangmaiensis]
MAATAVKPPTHTRATTARTPGIRKVPSTIGTPPPSVRATTPRAEELGVVGHRLEHGAQQVITSEMMARAVPGTNPLKVLAQMPGAMFQSDDPQGYDTWSNQFYMHGFLQNQIGMTLDGIPLGDQEFHSYNGLNSALAISSENVGRLNVSNGAGAESIASTSNLGGSVEYVSSDPKKKMGATIAQTFGSNTTMHTYARFDSGILNKSGTRFYASYARNDAHKWKGGADQFAQQVNIKLLQPIGHDSRISAFFDWADLEVYNYQDMSFDILKNGGYNIDNFVGTRNGYAKAYRSALSLNGLPGGSLPAGYSKMSDPWDASYYDGGTLEQDYLGGVNADLALTDKLRWKSVVYGHGQYSRGIWSNPYVASPNGAPLMEQMTITHTQRFGFTSALEYTIAHNHLSAGVWYENYNTDIGRYAFEQPLLGEGTPVNPMGSLAAPFATLWRQSFNSNSFTAFVQDTYNVLPNVALHFGFKSLLQTVRATETANLESYTGTAALTSGSMTTARAFLPHVSGDWHFLKHHELYFDLAENVKSYPTAGWNQGASPFSVSQTVFNQIRHTLQPETDWNYGVGYRFTQRYMLASLYGYHTNFKNRLQQVTSGSIVNPISTVANVGGVTMNGVDAGLTLMPIEGLALYNSVSYNHATYDDNLTEAGTTYHLRSQQIVSYPRFMYKASLSYRWHEFDAHLDTQYMGKRNFSYTGDTKVPAYWIETFGARWQAGQMAKYNRHLAFLHNLTLEFNIYNLTNTKYIATMGENGLPMSGDYQSFLVGAPRQFFGTVKMEF